MPKKVKKTEHQTKIKPRYYLDFHAFCYADSEAEAQVKMKELCDVTSKILCGEEGVHDCKHLWTVGGNVAIDQVGILYPNKDGS